jgi:trehalose 6-phosphate synthase/phosphatase
LSAAWRRLFSTDAEETAEVSEPRPTKRLFVVSSRLPITLNYDEEGSTFDCEQESWDTTIAGIISAIKTDPSLSGGGSCAPVEKVSEVLLVGTPVVRRKADGAVMPITEEMQKEMEGLCETMKVVPVFVDENRGRFAAWVLFPLFHYSPPSVETGLGLYDWEGYELVNQQFCSAVINEYSRGDLVWINDYALMLLPKMLRRERPDIHIGYYMDCVFPSSEVYRILPQREELLRGVLSANFIGFHNFQYVRHFLTSCTRVLGLECSNSGIEACEDAGGTCTKVMAVPLGMDLRPFQQLMTEEDTRMKIKELHDIFHSHGKKLLVALDRLEEKKGLPHKVMAFHKFLQKEPSWATKCVFVHIVEAVDSSPDDPNHDDDERQKLLQQVYQMVGECNSKFGTIGHLPVHFIFQDVNKTDIAALMAIADVMIDTPLRDMMSTSAHLCLCGQEAQAPGVLILSEFSGSAQSLRAAALCVNPWDTVAFADAIQEALEMPAHEKLELHRYGHRHVTEYTMSQWAVNFLDELQAAVDECEKERLEIPPQLDHDKAVLALRKAKRRVIILGFSGTLLPRKSRIHAKILPRLPEVLLGNLQVIAEDPHTDVVVLSGFARQALEQALGDVPCWIIAEGGLCYREPSQKEWHTTEEQRDTESDATWLGPCTEIMEYFAARTPGSTVIHTSCSVSWHYQKTQGDHAAIQSKDMLIHLWAGPLMSAPAEVVVGNDSVSVRPTGVSKSSMLEKALRIICAEGEEAKQPACAKGEEDRQPPLLGPDAFVICISDLLMRDEEVFVCVQKLFDDESADRKPPSKESADMFDEAMFGGARGGNPSPQDEIHFEANSKSLNDVYGRLAMGRSSPLADDESPPFGLVGFNKNANAESPFFGFKDSREFSDVSHASPEMPQKSPSEPDLSAALAGQVPGADFLATQANEPEDDNIDDELALFTCTVNRKATRAAYHLSDTNDVAFLIAKFARELRRMDNDQ